MYGWPDLADRNSAPYGSPAAGYAGDTGAETLLQIESSVSIFQWRSLDIVYDPIIKEDLPHLATYEEFIFDLFSANRIFNYSQFDIQYY